VENSPQTIAKPAEDDKNKGQIKSSSFIIQKYMEDPMLINKRKFDIRVWVLITMDCRVFLFKEGYLRMTSSNYDLTPESILRPEVHLTNNAVQSKFEDYGKFENGN
jgi:hypothetical protein